VAEFLGVTNVLAGHVAADGVTVAVSGAKVTRRIEGAGPGDAVTVVFKADAASVVEAGVSLPAGTDTVLFEGDLVEVFFVGSVYRHYVSAGDEMILVDDAARAQGPRVRVAVPAGELQIYPGAPSTEHKK